jgi:hypothetical protein
MNNFLCQTLILLSGQSAPFTGNAINVARLRENVFISYCSGAGGGVNLQYKSPFFENQWVDFYSFSSLGSGYSDSAYLDTPMTEIRAVCSGNGNFWCGCMGQN